MTTQQQAPNVLDPVSQAAWDTWADTRIRNIVTPLIADLDDLADEAGAASGQNQRHIFQLIEIMQALTAGDDYLRSRTDQVAKDFAALHGILRHDKTTRTVEEERSSRVEDVAATIEGILSDVS